MKNEDKLLELALVPHPPLEAGVGHFRVQQISITCIQLALRYWNDQNYKLGRCIKITHPAKAGVGHPGSDAVGANVHAG